MLKSKLLGIALIAVLSVGLPAFATDIPTPVGAGSKITFNAVSDGDAPISFEWFRDGVKVADGASWTIDKIDATHAGAYSLKASNKFGSATANDRVLLSIGNAPTAPRIIITLASAQVVRGTDYRLEIAAEGTPPIEYSWQHGNYVLRGENKPYILLSQIQNKDGGFWAVTARNKYGGARSDMTLSVVARR